MSVLFGLITFTCIYFFVYLNQYDKEIEVKNILISIVLFTAGFACLDYFSNTLLNMIYLYLCCFLILYKMFHLDSKRSFGYAALISLGIFICGFLTMYIIMLFLSPYQINFLKSFYEFTMAYKNIVYPSFLILYSLIFCLFLWMLFKIINLLNGDNLPKYTWIIFSMPIVSVLALVKLGSYSTLFGYKNGIVFVFISLVIYNIIILFLLYRLIQSSRMKKKLDEQLLIEENKKQKYDWLDKQYRANFKLVHKLYKECNDVIQLIHQNQSNQAAKKLDDFLQDSLREFNGVMTGSNVLNEVLYLRKNQLDEKNIYLKTTISYIDESFMSLTLQYDLFLFIIDFIIQSVENSKEINHITLSSEYKMDSLLIKIVLPTQEMNHLYTFPKTIMDLNVQYKIRKEETFNVTIITLLIYKNL